MRQYYYKWVCLLLAGSVLPAFFLNCDKAALNFQRGFWLGLGNSISDTFINSISGCFGLTT